MDSIRNGKARRSALHPVCTQGLPWPALKPGNIPRKGGIWHAGALAGVTATLTCFPLDVLRTRMMSPDHATGVLETLYGMVAYEVRTLGYARQQHEPSCTWELPRGQYLPLRTCMHGQSVWSALAAYVCNT